MACPRAFHPNKIGVHEQPEQILCPFEVPRRFRRDRQMLSPRYEDTKKGQATPESTRKQEAIEDRHRNDRVVSDAGYVDGWNFASHGIAVPVLFCFFVFCFVLFT